MNTIRICSQGALGLTKLHLIDRFTKPKTNLVIHNIFQFVKWSTGENNLKTPGSKARFGYRAPPITR